MQVSRLQMVTRLKQKWDCDFESCRASIGCGTLQGKLDLIACGTKLFTKRRLVRCLSQFNVRGVDGSNLTTKYFFVEIGTRASLAENGSNEHATPWVTALAGHGGKGKPYHSPKPKLMPKQYKHIMFF